MGGTALAVTYVGLMNRTVVVRSLRTLIMDVNVMVVWGIR